MSAADRRAIQDRIDRCDDELSEMRGQHRPDTHRLEFLAGYRAGLVAAKTILLREEWKKRAS